MPARRLGIGGDDDIGAKVQRALAERRHRGVVDDADPPRRVDGPGNRRDVAQVETGVRGGFDEDEAIAVKAALIEAGGRALIEAYPQLGKETVGEKPGGVIAVRGQKDAVACIQEGEEGRGDGRHAGGEEQRFGGFEMRQRLFHRLPCRVFGAAIAGEPRRIAGQVVHGAKRQGQRQRLPLAKRPAPEVKKLCGGGGGDLAHLWPAFG